MESSDSMLYKAVGLALAAILCIGVVGFGVGSCAPQEQEAAMAETVLSVDVNNAALMHRFGMPTKADVMEWHMSGQWGYTLGTTKYLYGSLPGDRTMWDAFYGIDPGNPAFKE